MTRKTKTIVGVGAACVLIVACLGIYLWLLIPESGSVVKNAIATAYWHKNVDPENLKEVRQYARKFGYNDDYYIVCDFGKRSGRKRFYVYDLNDGECLMKSYCMHGQGSGSTSKKAVFSNRMGSNASSVGLYALCGIGSKSIKNSILLEGLDRTNSNARARGLLIHSAKKVNTFHGQSDYIPIGIESNGCFVVTIPTLLKLMTIYKLHGRHKRILLWASA